MQVIEAQDALINLIKALHPGMTIADNAVETPQVTPYIAVDIEASELQVHGGGTLPPERHILSVYVLDSIKNHGESIRNTRGYVSQLANSIIAIPRVYAQGNVSYGEDVIANQRCCLALVKLSYPV